VFNANGNINEDTIQNYSDITDLLYFFDGMQCMYRNWRNYSLNATIKELTDAKTSEQKMIDAWKSLNKIKSQVANVKKHMLQNGKFAEFVELLGKLPQLMREADRVCNEFAVFCGFEPEHKMLDHQDIIDNINTIISYASE
jgi:hypothetical protein